MNYALVGGKEHGKTTRALSLAIDLGFPIIVFDPRSQFETFPVSSDPEEVMETWLSGANSTFRPQGEVEDEQAEFDSLVATLRPALEARIPLTVLVDESDRLKRSNGLSYLIRRTHKAHHNTLMLSHRMVDFPVLYRGQTDRFFFFAARASLDLKEIREFSNERVADMVSHLRRYEYIEYDQSDGEARFVSNALRRLWYIDIEQPLIMEEVQGAR